MTRRRGWRVDVSAWPALLVVAAIVAACSSGGNASTAAPRASASSAAPSPVSATTSIAANASPASRAGHAVPSGTPTPGRTAWGIGGLIPPHFPGSSAADWRTLYAAIPSLGGWLGAYFPYGAQGGIPAAAASQVRGSSQLGFQSLANIGFNHDAAGHYQSGIDFSVPAQVAAYRDALAAFATETHPPFLGIGNEVNRFWEEDPAGYEQFARAVPGIVQAIHRASPATRVFVTFQYEFLLGAGQLSGHASERQPEWALVDALAPALDLVGFTTYPYFDYATPADIPADYYRQAREHVAKPIGFTEIGWPAAPLPTAPDSPLGGSPEEQAAFVKRLPELFRGVDPAFAMWVYAYDTPAAGATFASLGLSAQDGTPRPALAAWKRIVAGQ